MKSNYNVGQSVSVFFGINNSTFGIYVYGKSLILLLFLYPTLCFEQLRQWGCRRKTRVNTVPFEISKEGRRLPLEIQKVFACNFPYEVTVMLLHKS